MTCTVLHIPATPAALAAKLGDRAHATGPVNAPVAIVVFSDYQCPYCALLAARLKLILQAHPNDVRLVYVNTPLSNRDKDRLPPGRLKRPTCRESSGNAQPAFR